MKYFNELNEAYERTMMARGEPEKEETMPETWKLGDAEVYDWEQFLEWAHIPLTDHEKENDEAGESKNRDI